MGHLAATLGECGGRFASGESNDISVTHDSTSRRSCACTLVRVQLAAACEKARKYSEVRYLRPLGLHISTQPHPRKPPALY